MTLITKNFQFRLTNVQNQSITAQTEQNVKKRIADIVYFEQPTEDAVKLEYVGSKEITPSSVLSIADRSDRMFPNSKNNKAQEFFGYLNSSSIPVQNKNFLVTQEFISSRSKDIPLYYKFEIPQNVILESITVYDQNFNKVASDKIKIVIDYVREIDTGIPSSDIENVYLFNSLENSFNYDTGEYIVYYVQYTKVVDSENIIVTTLLNNSLAYQKAVFSDFWHLTPGSLKPWVRAYTFSTGLNETNDYLISLPSSRKYAVKYNEVNRVRVLSPIDFSDNGPWFPRIHNGGFTYGYNGFVSKYDIPEFKEQGFSPFEPYKLCARNRCAKITDSLIKLPHEEIVFGQVYSSIYLYFEQDGVIKHGITNDVFKTGTPILNSFGNQILDSSGDTLLWDSAFLVGIDQLSGIVQVGIKVLDNYDIYASYNYKENFYIVSNLFMNPVFDQEVSKCFYPVYLVPKNNKNNNIGNNSQKASVNYLRVSKNGTIEFTTQDGEDNNPNLDFDVRLSSTDGFMIEGCLGLSYSRSASTTIQSTFPSMFETLLPDIEINVTSTALFPKQGWLRCLDSSGYFRYFKYIDKTSTSFILSDSLLEVPSEEDIFLLTESSIEFVNFIDEHTNLSTRTGSDELSHFGLNSNGIYPSVYSQYFLLAELSVNPPHKISDLSRIDVRENGGGIIEEKYNEAKQLNPEVQWLSDCDHFNGQIYPGNSVIVVKLPFTLKNDFSLSQIKSIVSENIPFGVKPLIRFYGYQPRIISITPSTESATIEWEKEGEEFVYDIWYSVSANGKFIKANSTRLTDGAGATNSYSVNGLVGKKPYIIRITMKDKYYQWWYGYDSPTDISGGLGLTESSPVAPFGNVSNLQFYVGA